MDKGSSRACVIGDFAIKSTYVNNLLPRGQKCAIQQSR